jgi:alpha-beta hydrolase superfamily lysophospholipase
METRAATLSPFTASDGENIALRDWPLPPGMPSRGVVVLVHGLGEHAGRHARLADRLNSWGFAVRGYDQFGHGESSGPRGGLPSPLRLLEDLADVVESTRQRMESAAPLILLGHSMGGLVAAGAVARGLGVDALVLSSPAFAAQLNAVQKLLLAVVPRLAPNLAVGNGLDPAFLSHDEQVVAAYQSDPLVHDRITGRLARFITTGGAEVLARAAQWKVPTLLLYAGDDRLVDPAGSRAFAGAAPADVVSPQCFDGLYHEIFNETQARPVYASLMRWLDERFSASATATAGPRR